VERVTVADELDALDVPPLAERASAQALADRADAALRDLDCAVAVRSFTPETLPTLFVADPGVLRRLQREHAKDAGSGFWAQVLNRIDAAEPDPGASGRLCLNWRNRLVRALAGSDDELLLARTVRVLYVQSLLAAHRPLRAAERTALTDALTDIVHLSSGLTPDVTGIEE
jgi:molecular chaperone HtpG